MYGYVKSEVKNNLSTMDRSLMINKIKGEWTLSMFLNIYPNVEIVTKHAKAHSPSYIYSFIPSYTQKGWKYM